MVFLFMCSSYEDTDVDECSAGGESSSQPKRKMSSILTYEMGYLVWDPSPSGKCLNNSMLKH